MELAIYIEDIQISYKHFGIPQSHGNHDEVVRNTAKQHQRIRQNFGDGNFGDDGQRKMCW